MNAMLMARLRALAIVLLATATLGGGSILVIYRSVAAEPQAANQTSSASASSPRDQRTEPDKTKENRHELKEAKEDDAEAEEAL
ncbi:hypothetical protein, partial [Escherichia coli]|uniref:hypothetical protein n=1 Tax=Escherichia coli TaxID=562 RepID=UPI003F48B6FD